MTLQTKKCPMCAERIPLEATVCEYCGAHFEVAIRDGQVQSKFIEESLPGPTLPTEIQLAPLPERRGNSWLLIPIIIVIMGAVAGLLWFAGKNMPAIPAVKAIATRTPAHIPSRTPNYKATTQARNTQVAATAQFAWVDSFAGPILSEIEGHAPNFEDDFSDLSGRFARWSYISGDVTFTEGVMRINTTGHDGVDAGGSMIATDFVLEYEFTPRIASDGSCAAADFRWNDAGGYDFDFNLKDSWRGMISIPTEQEGRILAEGSSQEAGLNRRTSITVIAKGDRFAFYANGKPLFYAEDSLFDGDWAGLSVWSPNGPSEVDFDNVKFWDLNNLKP